MINEFKINLKKVYCVNVIWINYWCNKKLLYEVIENLYFSERCLWILKWINEFYMEFVYIKIFELIIYDWVK